MPALEASLAVRTTTDMDVELPMNGPPWNLALILLIDACFDDRSAAIGTSFWQRRLVGFVDFRRRLAMSLNAVIVAGLASRLSRFLLGLSLGKRRGLSLAGSASVFEKPRQFGDFRPQVSDLAFETRTVETRRDDHTFTVSLRETFSCASFPEKCGRCGRSGGNPLIKYTRT